VIRATVPKQGKAIGEGCRRNAGDEDDESTRVFGEWLLEKSGY
jgi:hypothetical protein